MVILINNQLASFVLIEKRCTLPGGKDQRRRDIVIDRRVTTSYLLKLEHSPPVASAHFVNQEGVKIAIITATKAKIPYISCLIEKSPYGACTRQINF